METIESSNDSIDNRDSSFDNGTSEDDSIEQDASYQKKRKIDVEESEETVESHTNKRVKARNKFIYGNYEAYYGYREKGKEDIRLALLEKSWFEGKKCLDIGCNNGKLTFNLVKKFEVKQMKAIDIDSKLISNARSYVDRVNSRALNDVKKGFDFPISLQINLGPIPDFEYPRYYPITFVTANFLEYEDNDHYDIITCLSVTKWIQLNWGDDGIKKLFQKVYDLLNPGGLFIMEPQLTPSYKKKATLTETTKRNYKSMKLKPEQFCEYLTKELQFKLFQTVEIPEEPSISKNFARPIFVFSK